MRLALLLFPQAEADIDEHCFYIDKDTIDAAIWLKEAIFSNHLTPTFDAVFSSCERIPKFRAYWITQ
jgi:hypothetical protein